MNKQARFLATLVGWLLAAVVHAGTVTYIHTDAQGTPVMESDAQGHITKRFEYTPYGVVVTSMGAAPDGPGYTGHVNDPETGLVYMQARYYDPLAGRFLSVDPVGPVPGGLFNLNRYAYVSNNPIVNIDPDGKHCYGYGTTIPDCGPAILDCHQTNSCKSRAEADAIVRKDAKTIVLIQAGTATTAAATAAGVAAYPVIAPVAKKTIIKAICTYGLLCPNSEQAYPPSQKYNPMDPPGELQMGEQREKLSEMWRKLQEYLKQREPTPTEPRPASPPPPPPEPPPAPLPMQ